MTIYSYCNDCALVIAGPAGRAHHTSLGHDCKNMYSDELVKHNLAKSAAVLANQPTVIGEDAISFIYKEIGFMGKSGKIVKSRREGSYVFVRYFYAPSHNARLELTEQEYFALLFKNGVPPAELMHTFSSKHNYGDFVRDIYDKQDTQTNIFVTQHPDNGDSLLIHASPYSIADIVISRPFYYMTKSIHESYSNCGDSYIVKYLQDTDSSARTIDCDKYFDLLRPRLGHHTRLLITFDDKPKNKTVLIYQPTEEEERKMQMIRTSASVEDWSADIAEDARAILCS